MNDPLAGSLVTSVRSLIERTAMIPRGSRILAAVSGGQDSSAMLHALWQLRSELNIDITVAHLNHGFRGAESEADAELVGDTANQYRLPLISETVDVPDMSRRIHRGAQEAARIARHAFLERAAETSGANGIALAHTQDDHIETVLLNILRGTGTDGLSGLPAIAGNRVRPLRDVTRNETAAYCAALNIPFREDASNRSVKYLRNRLREELLPELASYYNPEVRRAIMKLSDIAAAEADFLEGHARAFLEAWARRQPGELRISRRVLGAAHIAVRRRVIRQAIQSVRGNLTDVEFAHVEQIAIGVGEDNGGGTAFTLPGAQVAVGIDDDDLSIRGIRPHASPIAWKTDVQVPGRTIVPQLGIVIEARVGAVQQDVPESATALCVVLDAGQVASPVRVRGRRPGDRLQPIGMVGTRKLQDILVDRKIPAGRRDHVPIVEDANGIIWVAGCTFSERARVRKGTRQSLTLAISEQKLGAE